MTPEEHKEYEELLIVREKHELSKEQLKRYRYLVDKIFSDPDTLKEIGKVWFGGFIKA